MGTDSMDEVRAGTTYNGALVSVVLAIACPVAIWVGLLGSAWVYVPANPAAGTAAAYLSFADLSAAYAGSPAAALQSAYFDWLAWTLAAITTLLVVVVARSSSHTAAMICIAFGLAQLVIVALALKGPLPWSTVIDGLGNTRLGAALVIAGSATLIALGLRQWRAGSR